MAYPQYANQGSVGMGGGCTPLDCAAEQSVLTANIWTANSVVRSLIASLEKLNEKVSGPSLKEMPAGELNKSVHEPSLIEQMASLNSELVRAQKILEVLRSTI